MEDESPAIFMIKKAVAYDESKKYSEALFCYTEGIELLLKVLKNDNSNTNNDKRQSYRLRITQYINRAEELKLKLDEIKKTGKYHEQIQIENDSCGNSYEKLFSRFFDDPNLDECEIIDPYIRVSHQLHNFLRFCELIVKLSKNIKKIKLITSYDSDNRQVQQDKLNEIKNSLNSRSIQLIIEFKSDIHDREIILSTGWIIKIGRGLNYFKPPSNPTSNSNSSSLLSIGYHDLDLRPCLSTTIDIFHRNSMKKIINK
jgi:hypothetical protein